MAKAYVNTPTNHQKESLTNVKCGFKECTQVGPSLYTKPDHHNILSYSKTHPIEQSPPLCDRFRVVQNLTVKERFDCSENS